MKVSYLGSMQMAMAVVALTACGGCFAEPGDMHGDETFTPAEREDIVAGAEWLAVQTGHPARAIVFDLPHDADCGAGDILRVDGFGGLYDGQTGCIVIGVRRSAIVEEFEPLVAHELGHAVGLADVEEQGSLMYSPAPKLRWSPADQAECWRVGYCTLSQDGK